MMAWRTHPAPGSPPGSPKAPKRGVAPARSRGCRRRPAARPRPPIRVRMSLSLQRFGRQSSPGDPSTYMSTPRAKLPLRLWLLLWLISCDAVKIEQQAVRRPRRSTTAAKSGARRAWINAVSPAPARVGAQRRALSLASTRPRARVVGRENSDLPEQLEIPLAAHAGRAQQVANDEDEEGPEGGNHERPLDAGLV